MTNTISALLFMKLVYRPLHAVMPQNMSCYGYSADDAQMQTPTAKNKARHLSENKSGIPINSNSDIFSFF
jgi:hypothetical protein